MWRAAPLGWCESLQSATDLDFHQSFEPPPPWPVAAAGKFRGSNQLAIAER